MARYLKRQWGIGGEAADRFALLYGYLWMYGLQPEIQSGYRSPAKQAELRRRWDAGERQGLAARPAATSTHTQRMAIDISTADPTLAGQIAEYLGIRAGVFFSDPDPVHFDLKNAL